MQSHRKRQGRQSGMVHPRVTGDEHWERLRLWRGSRRRRRAAPGRLPSDLRREPRFWRPAPHRVTATLPAQSGPAANESPLQTPQPPPNSHRAATSRPAEGLVLELGHQTTTNLPADHLARELGHRPMTHLPANHLGQAHGRKAMMTVPRHVRGPGPARLGMVRAAGEVTALMTGRVFVAVSCMMRTHLARPGSRVLRRPVLAGALMYRPATTTSTTTPCIF